MFTLSCPGAIIKPKGFCLLSIVFIAGTWVINILPPRTCSGIWSNGANISCTDKNLNQINQKPKINLSAKIKFFYSFQFQ